MTNPRGLPLQFILRSYAVVPLNNSGITCGHDRVNVNGLPSLWLADAVQINRDCTIPELSHREPLPKPLILVSLKENGIMRAMPC